MSTRQHIALWHNLPSGGGKRALMEQVKRMSKKVDITLFTTTLVDDSFCPIEPYCIEVHKVAISDNPFMGFQRIKRRYQQAQEIYKCSFEVADKINSGSFAAVYVASCQVEHTPSLLRRLTLPTVYYCQEGLREYYEPQPKLESLKDAVGRVLRRPELIRRMLRDKAAMRSGVRVVVNSKTTQETIKRWYGVEAEICYPGVDTEKFFPSKENIKETERTTFLSVGRLNQLKGHDFIIQVLTYLPERYRVLTIAYDQEGEAEHARLQKLAESLGVTVHFAYRISDEALRRSYQTCWAVLCGQKREPFGLIPVEAMACGALVCAVAEGGFRETLQDRVTGLLVKRDAKAMAAILQGVLADTKRLNSLRKAGVEDVRNRWTWEKSCEQLLSYLLG